LVHVGGGKSHSTLLGEESPETIQRIHFKFYSLGGCVSRKPVLNGFFGYNGQPFSPLWEQREVRDRGEKALISLSDRVVPS